ncbi:RNA polymerase sigma factor SigJ [Streptomyces sp. NPDC051940]|uniref:RNA polymerase sigma factor SigJ n=1 Tax=Streptomyces sp. NPDC051940 TaxID=3155675 RepID=UPI00341BE015
MPDHPVRDPAAATEVFMEHRELLFSIVYNMLGSVADTEDVLQDSWLSWAGRGESADIANPRAYLVRIAVNHALTRQAAARRRREAYVGPWLPEPLATDEAPDAAEPALRAESVSLALLVVLETLSPLERAVFVLHEVFGYPHGEIAAVIERSPAAVRQLARRAREHVQARRPRFEAHPRVQEEATRRFVEAALGRDVEALMEVLAPDVTVWTDSGGKVRGSALRPVHGRDKAVRLLTGYARRGTAENYASRHQTLNGDASLVFFSEGAPYAVMMMDLTPDGRHVTDIFIVTNPDKLGGVPGETAEEEQEQ